MVTSSQNYIDSCCFCVFMSCCDTSDCVRGEAGALPLFECVPSPSVILVTVFGVRQEPYHCSSVYLQ